MRLLPLPPPSALPSLILHSKPLAEPHTKNIHVHMQGIFTCHLRLEPLGHRHGLPRLALAKEVGGEDVHIGQLHSRRQQGQQGQQAWGVKRLDKRQLDNGPPGSQSKLFEEVAPNPYPLPLPPPTQ